MATTIPPLAPTLWRTCRVLANEARLRILAEVLHAPGIGVTPLARRLGLSQSQASQHLRLLQSRGLLHVRRVGRYAEYRPHAEPSVVHADPLLAATRAALKRREPVEEMVRAFTAFTHERRIILYRALEAGIDDRAALVRRTGISRPALKRHLRKFARRGVVDLSGSEVRLVSLPPGLLCDLARLASSRPSRTS
jgi:DNA-binding transcriptional ArsR family regulator